MSDSDLKVLQIRCDAVAYPSNADLAFFPFWCGSLPKPHGTVGLESAVGLHG